MKINVFQTILLIAALVPGQCDQCDESKKGEFTRNNSRYIREEKPRHIDKNPGRKTKIPRNNEDKKLVIDDCANTNFYTSKDDWTADTLTKSCEPATIEPTTKSQVRSGEALDTKGLFNSNLV